MEHKIVRPTRSLTSTPTGPPTFVVWRASRGDDPLRHNRGMMSSKRRKGSASVKRLGVNWLVISQRWRHLSGFTRRVDHRVGVASYPQAIEITRGFGSGLRTIAAEARGKRLCADPIAGSRMALGSARSPWIGSRALPPGRSSDVWTGVIFAAKQAQRRRLHGRHHSRDQA